MKKLLCAVSIGAMAAVCPAQKASRDVVIDPADGDPTCNAGETTLCIPLDESFSVPSMDATGGSGEADPFDPCQRNDDDSTLAIPLEFTFDFYGDQYDTVYVNNNGNVSFGGPFATFSPSGFPVADFPMIAPFWGDVDTRSGADGAGVVWIRSESNRFTVIWDHVGYFSSSTDKQNTFQLILTDGTDPLVGIGNNVCFCYDDMQWTTGDASGGSGGFGGTPATVGANKGDGTEFFLVGRFDAEGTCYDGPGGANDCVSFLDDSTICFSTLSGGDNVPPILTEQPAGDAVSVSIGATVDFDVAFISPEEGQTTTIEVDDGGLSSLSCALTPGNPATAACTLLGDPSEVGQYTVTFTATDDDPIQPLSTVYEVTVDVTSPVTTIDEGCAGSEGTPMLTSIGTFQPNTDVTLDLVDAAPLAPAVLMVGVESAELSRQGCPLSFLPSLLVPLGTDRGGQLTVSGRWPEELAVPTVWLQYYVIDGGAPTGFATSNTLVVEVP